LKSIFRKSFSGFLVVILILAVLVPLLIFNNVRSKLNSLAVANLTRTAETLEFIISPVLSMETSELDSIVDELGRRLNLRITLISRNGNVLADSEEQPDSMENHRTRPEVICAFNGQTGSSLRNSETLDREMLYVAVPMTVGDSIPAVIRTSLFFSEQRLMLNGILFDMTIIMTVILIAGLLFAWYSSRRIAGPIRSIASATRRVGEGDYSVRAAPCSVKELSDLASDINGMIIRTDGLIEELSEKNTSLDAVLSSIVEGLLVVDKDGNVLITNKSFRRMSKSVETEGVVHYIDVIGNGDFREFIGRIVRDGNADGEFKTDGRTYSGKSAVIPETGQNVLTFSDVTEVSETVRMKREFAANASHELRTPLTSIKGFAETLLDNLSGDQRKYAETILRNADRLIRIVDDMRTLSMLEQPFVDLDITEMNLEELIDDCLELFRSSAEEKGLQLIFEKEDKVPSVQADRFRMEQVLINLIENALKYTSEGTVAVRLGSRGNFITIIVSDTGAGIPEEHLGRLFERFYVIDKARSRNRGGTGLGLAIVKHIMTLHGGWIRVSSTPGSGTMFTVGLPAGKLADRT
jgi:two-component system, OmpR family, phosphate regulon sensor histidine kinase PhoR